MVKVSPVLDIDLYKQINSVSIFELLCHCWTIQYLDRTFFFLIFSLFFYKFYINYNIKSSNRYQNSLNLFFNDKIMAKCLSQELFH